MTVDVSSRLNLEAYNGVENLANFTSQKGIENYREERLRFSEPYVRCLVNELGQGFAKCCLDLGSGSSAFLYALKNAGLIQQGVGVEISTTRNEFAEKWRTDCQYENISNILGDVADIPSNVQAIDLCTILDSTFTYFYPIDRHFPKKVLKDVWQRLNFGGWLYLEFPTFEEAKRQCVSTGEYFEWSELPESNAFKYSMYRTDLDEVNGLLKKTSVYTFRDKLGDTSKTEVTKIYSSAEIEDLLTSAGYSNLRVYGGLDRVEYIKGVSESIVVFAQKV